MSRLSAVSKNHEILADRSLKLSDLDTRHQGLYRCVVDTSFETSSQNTSLVVLGEAPVIKTQFSNYILNQGKNHDLRCEASGNPLPKITWLLNDQFIPERSRSLVEAPIVNTETLVASTLKLINATAQESAGNFTCLAENRYGSTTKTKEVRVIAPTTIDINGSQKVIEAKAGGRLKIPCRIMNDKQNKITKLEWLKDNGPTGSDSVFGYDNNGANLVIPNVQVWLLTHFFYFIKNTFLLARKIRLFGEISKKSQAPKKSRLKKLKRISRKTQAFSEKTLDCANLT